MRGVLPASNASDSQNSKTLKVDSTTLINSTTQEANLERRSSAQVRSGSVAAYTK